MTRGSRANLRLNAADPAPPTDGSINLATPLGASMGLAPYGGGLDEVTVCTNAKGLVPMKRRKPGAACHGRQCPAGSTHRTNKPRQEGAVLPSELERDVLAFIAERYEGRHLDIETTQLGLGMVTPRAIRSDAG